LAIFCGLQPRALRALRSFERVPKLRKSGNFRETKNGRHAVVTFSWTHLSPFWKVGTFSGASGAGNGDYRGELRQAIAMRMGCFLNFGMSIYPI
jgi:hypothetical protein